MAIDRGVAMIRRCRHTPFALLLSFVLVLVASRCWAQNKGAAAAAAPVDDGKAFLLDFLVTDKALGKPLAGVAISARADGDRQAYVTDETGHALIEYPPTTKRLTVSAK